MASAILASRNEPCWGRKVYMRKYTNSNNPHLKFKSSPKPNPNPKPNSNSSRQIHDPTSKNHSWHSQDPPPPPAAPASDDSSSLNRRTVNLNDRKESSHSGYVTYNLSAYTRRELKEIKKRLILELEQVRSLRNRIESREFESRSSYHTSKFSGSFGSKDAPSVARPPPLQIDYKFDSPSTVTPSKRTPKVNQCYPPSEFLIGKNKMTPSEKKLSGSKRPVSVISSGDPKKQMVEPVTEKLVTSMMRRCGQILTKLMKHKLGWVFNVPVDAVKLGLHDYHQIIKHPMDLGTVKVKMENNEYRMPMDFAADVRLTFNNAMLYNPKGQDVYFMAEQLLSFFDEMFNPAYKKFEDENRRMLGTEEGKPRQRQHSWTPAPPPNVDSVRRLDPMPLVKKSDRMRAQPTLSAAPQVQMQPSLEPGQMQTPSSKPRLTAGKLPKPKAKDPNKRQMSYEEKAKLGMNLQNLPPEKMDQLLLIIKKRNEHLAQDGDEIELDIETVDTETLWELDRFVSNYKKMVSKVKRQGLINNQTQINKSPVSELPEASQKNRKGETGEEDVDIGDEIPMNNYPPVEIEKDAANASSRSSSSSSSSSSSDSSSSDSDSGSSSGSESDADSVQSPYVELKAPPET